MNLVDPLSGHSDPRFYVALETGERALAEIGAGLRAGRSPVLLSGPSGIGKTLLLRMVAEREWASFERVRFSSMLSVEPEALADCLLHLLFGKRSADAREAEIALVMNLRSPHVKPTLLLVDNIHRASLASVRKLAALASASAPALAIAVTGTNGPALSELSAALAPEVTVSLPESLPELEIEALYDSYLAHPGLAPRLRQRLATVPRDEVTRSAAGLPRLLKSELVRRNQDRWVPLGAPPPAERPRPTIVPAPAPPGTPPAAQTMPTREPRPHVRRIPAVREAVRSSASHLAGPLVVIARAAGALRALLFATFARLTGVARTIRAAPRSAGVRVQRASALLLRSVRDAAGDSASRLGNFAVAAERSARASLVAANANLTGVRKQLGAAARSAGAGVRSVRDAIGDSASRLGDSALAVERSARASLVAANANLTGVRKQLGAAARSAGAGVRSVRDAIGDSASRLGDSALAVERSARASLVAANANLTGVRRQLGAAARSAGADVHRASTLSLRSATESARRARVAVAELYGKVLLQLAPTDVSRSAREAAGRAHARLASAAARGHSEAASLLTSSLAWGTRGQRAIRTTVRTAVRRSSAALARERAGLRVGPVAALPAAALLVVALFSVGQYDTVPKENRAVAANALEHLEAVTPSHGAPAALSRAKSETRPPPPVNVQVNARPWAQVSINGVAVGPTPLTRPLAPGVYQLEAEFPDGRKVQRKIDVDRERRFVSLP